MSYDFNNYKKDTLTRPKDLAWSNWGKFEKVGDKVQGFVRDAFYGAAQGVFKDYRGITLEQIDGTLINVRIKYLDFILAATDNVHIGDPLTIELVDLKPSKTKGFSETKIFAFYSPQPTENPQNPTVKELTDKDKASGGTTAPVADDAELEAMAAEAAAKAS